MISPIILAMPDPEPVIVSLNTELYYLKGLVLTLQIENAGLLARIAEIDAAVNGRQGSAMAAGVR